MWAKPLRWSDNDHYWGPFTYARDKNYRRIAAVISSGDDDYPGCNLMVSLSSHTIIMALPQIIKPYRKKVYPQSWGKEVIQRLGRDWYWDTHKREYGFSFTKSGAVGDGQYDFLQIYLGRQTNDSSTTQQWSKFLPWAQWRHVRHSLYDLDGNIFATMPKSYEKGREIEDKCPKAVFAFADFDGEELTVKTHIEEREWKFGAGWFKWLSVFKKPKISRCLDLEFSSGIGERKGSWKGGTVGHAIELLPGELHESGFKRYCEKHNMKFIGQELYKTRVN